MRILTRQAGEAIRIGDTITVQVVRVGRDTVKLAIEAPHEMPIKRGELEPKEEESAA